MTYTIDNKIHQLEGVIRIHEQFLTRESLFTFVEVDERYKVVMYDHAAFSPPLCLPADKEVGLLPRRTESDRCAIRFRDITEKAILQYLPTVKIEYKDQQGELVLIETSRERLSGRMAIKEPLYLPYNPTVVAFPLTDPLDLYLAWLPDHNPLEDLERFKEHILTTAKNASMSAKSQLNGLLNQKSQSEQALREAQRREAERREQEQSMLEQLKAKSGTRI